MKTFFKSLAFKVGGVVILVEICVLSAVGVFFIDRFNSAVDARLHEKISIPGDLILGGVLNVGAIARPDFIKKMVGEELVMGLIVGPDRRVIYSLDASLLQKHVADIPGIQASWFRDRRSSGHFAQVPGGLAKVTPIFTLDADRPSYYTLFVIDTMQALKDKRAAIWLVIAGTIAATLVTSLAILLLFRSTLLARIVGVLKTLAELQAGAFSARVTDAIRTDEIGKIQSGVNTMAAELEQRNRAQAEAEQALKRSEKRFKHFAETAADWFWETDAKHRFTFLSDGYKQRSGISSGNVLGKTLTELFAATEDDQKWGRLEKELDSRYEIRGFEFTVSRADESARIARISGKPRFDKGGNFIGYGGSGIDVTEAYILSQKLTYHASHDALTGLANRRAFEHRLTALLASARATGESHALCYLDLDQFKVVNDTCGHVAGDELLRQLADRLHDGIRKRDLLARLGGDEFGILIEDCSLKQATRVAHAAQRAVGNFQFAWGDGVFRVGASIGLVPISAHSTGVTEILSAADSACYEAKEQGRNRVHVFHPDDEELARRHGEMRWVNRIHQALDEGRIRLFTQPIVPLDPARTCGEYFEVLIRIEDIDGRLILPGQFLPAAERYNLSVQLDRRVVTTVFEWLRTYPQGVDNLHLCCINLSGHSLTDDMFLEFLVTQFEDSLIPAEKICWEVTETTAVANLSSACRFMNTLRERGCKFALDDFGSGVSSFGYLNNLPVDYLKIDGAFIKDIVTNPVNRAIVGAIRDVAKATGKLTVCEFVEDRECMAALRAIGLDYAQGYAIGVPQPITHDESSNRRAIL